MQFYTKYADFPWEYFMNVLPPIPIDGSFRLWEQDRDLDQNGSLYIMLNLHTATYVGT